MLRRWGRCVVSKQPLRFDGVKADLLAGVNHQVEELVGKFGIAKGGVSVLALFEISSESSRFLHSDVIGLLQSESTTGRGLTFRDQAEEQTQGDRPAHGTGLFHFS